MQICITDIWLTYLENLLRRLAGDSGYHGTFIERYLEPILYPIGITRHSLAMLGVAAVCCNLLVYLYLWRRRKGNSP